MSDITQSLANHTRWHPIYHFVLSPILLINLLWSVVRLFREPSLEHGWMLVMAFALVVMVLLVRINPLKAQDRLIRLEEQLRYQRVLPADLAAKASAMSVGKIVALRFAPDEELAGLVQQVLDGKLKDQKEIKQAIKNWRGDYFRV